jgi:nucleoside-diphosphate-sugar epimerase
MALGITGRNNDVSTEKAQKLLGWKTRLSYEEAMQTIEAWVKNCYLPSRKES